MLVEVDKAPTKKRLDLLFTIKSSEVECHFEIGNQRLEVSLGVQRRAIEMFDGRSEALEMRHSLTLHVFLIVELPAGLDGFRRFKKALELFNIRVKLFDFVFHGAEHFSVRGVGKYEFICNFLMKHDLFAQCRQLGVQLFFFGLEFTEINLGWIPFWKE
jgi:hypothetical protein